MLSHSDRIFIAMMAMIIIVGCATNDFVRAVAFCLSIIAAVAYVFVPPAALSAAGQPEGGGA